MMIHELNSITKIIRHDTYPCISQISCCYVNGPYCSWSITVSVNLIFLDNLFIKTKKGQNKMM